MNLNDYDYKLDKSLVAKFPPKVRGLSNLLVYNTDTDQIEVVKYKNLYKFIEHNTLIVRNVTKVLNARVKSNVFLRSGRIKKDVEVFVLASKSLSFKNFVQQSLQDDNTLKLPVMVKLKFNQLKQVQLLVFKDGWRAVYKENLGKTTYLSFYNINIYKEDSIVEKFISFLKKYGEVPIPPYLHRSCTESDKIRYQTIFSKYLGSVAAPTASLNFTKQLEDILSSKGCDFADIVLHVGLGTFAPLTIENIKNKKLHSEFVFIDRNNLDKILKAKRQGQKILALGTTSVRALESYALKFPMEGGAAHVNFTTDLFIYPPYDFKIVDMLLTNFHFPKTSLLALVDAFLQYKNAKKSWRDLYNFALQQKFKFYSYGDSMLIL